MKPQDFSRFMAERREPPKIEFGDLVGFLCQSKDLFFYVTLYDLIMRVQVWPYKIVCHSFHDWISCFYELMRLILLTCIYQSTAQLLLSLLVAAVVVFSYHWYDPLFHVAALTMFHTAEPNGMREALVCFVPQDKHNDMYNSNVKLQRSNDPFLALTDRNPFRLIIVSPFRWKIINLPSFFPPDGAEAPVRHFAFVLRLGLPGHSSVCRCPVLEGTCIWAVMIHQPFLEVAPISDITSS